MNYAIITAAGKGTRAHLEVPKQFYKVYNKPLLAYTLEAFQKCTDIDSIVLVLSQEYIDEGHAIVKEYGISKANYFCVGGETNQMSIFNGFKALSSVAKDNDIVVVHDGVRCLVSPEIISSNIETCKTKGNGITAIPCNEAMLYTEDGFSSSKSIDRSKIYKTQTPHSIGFKDGYGLLKRTFERGVANSVALCTMLIEDGQKVYFSKGSNLNFKVTQPEDIELFECYLNKK